MRWLAITALALLVCGGVLTLGGYAGFEWWRVNGSGEAVEASVEAAPPPGSAEAVMVAEAPAAPSTSCEDGAAAFAARDYDGATTQLDVCLSLTPDRPELRMLRGRAWAAVGRFERAEDDLEVALKELPDDALGWEALVYSQVRSEHDRAAQTTLDRWIARSPDSGPALRMRADVRYRLGELGLARDDADRACALGDADGCTLAARMKDARRKR
jgi:predicted Zn-dependent protease